MIPLADVARDRNVPGVIREYLGAGEDAPARSHDYAALLSDILEMGRSRNPKKDRLSMVLEDWNPVDAYIVARTLDGVPFSDPARTLDFGGVLEREAIADAFFGGDTAHVKTLVDEHGSLSRALKNADVSVSSGVAENPTLESLYETMCDLADEGSEHNIVTTIEHTVQTLEHPWVFTFMLENDLPTYLGTSMIRDAISMATGFSTADLDEALGITNDVGIVLVNAFDGELKLRVEPHDLLAPMKAESKDDDPEFNPDDWIAETKYDGARIFVHNDEAGDFAAYTGGNLDVTNALPELYEMNWPDTSFIFDMEVVGYNPETGEVKPFQSIMERLTRTGGVDVARRQTEARVKIFDCLYWDGGDIRYASYDYRRDKVVSNFLPVHVAQAGDDITATFERSLADDHEGVVLKRKGHRIQLGTRSNDWLKWKAEPETADLRVIGAERGGGDMSDRLGALKVGTVQDGETIPLGKVGTGFSDDDRVHLWDEYERGSLIDSIVEVDFEELQKNEDGWGLRFPRFIRMRLDGEAEVDSFERIKDIAKVSA